MILIGLCSPDIKNVLFFKPGKGKVSQTLYNPHLAADKTLSDHILFLHAMSGCDTTSALLNQEKLKFLKVLQRNNDLQPVIDAFKDPHAYQDEIAEAGNVFLMARYGKGHETSLNDLRYRQYVSSSYKSKTNIASLPPTTTFTESLLSGAAVVIRSNHTRRATKRPERVGVEKIKEWSRASANHFEPYTGLDTPAHFL